MFMQIYVAGVTEWREDLIKTGIGKVDLTVFLLQSAYNDRDTVYNTIRQLLSLPYLPADAIPGTFQRFIRRHSNAILEPLLEYIQLTWIESSLWPPAAWSVYRETVIML